jgi:hypothetical protein
LFSGHSTFDLRTVHENPMQGTFFRDLEKARSLRVVELAFEFDDSFDHDAFFIFFHESNAGIAGIELPSLPIRVHLHGNGSTGAEGRLEQVMGARTFVVTAQLRVDVGRELVRAGLDVNRIAMFAMCFHHSPVLTRISRGDNWNRENKPCQSNDVPQAMGLLEMAVDLSQFLL